MITIRYKYKNTPIDVTVSNIEWDNMSVGVTDFGGNISNDAQPDYISSFDIEKVVCVEQPEDDQENMEILRYKYDEDADFIHKLEEELIIGGLHD